MITNECWFGIANLHYLDAALADRKEKYARYKEILSQNPEITFQKIKLIKEFLKEWLNLSLTSVAGL